MATLGDLVIKMSLDMAGFVSDMGKASYASEKFADNVQRKLNNAATAARQFGSQFKSALSGVGGEGLQRATEGVEQVVETFKELSHSAGPAAGAIGAVGIAATAAVAGMSAIAIETAHAVEEMSHAAEAAQIDADAFQAIALAAEEAGVPIDKLVTSINRLNQQMVEAAQGSNQAADDFARLGVSVTEGGNLRATEDVLRDVAHALSEMPAGADRAAISLRLLNRTGTQLTAFLREFDEKVNEAKNSTAIFGEELRKQTEQYTAAAARVHQGIQGIANAIARAFLPTLTALLEVFAEWLKALNESISVSGDAASSFSGMAQALALLLIPVGVLVDGFNGVRIILGTVVDGFVAAVEAVGALGAAINAFVRGDAAGLREALEEASTALKEFQERADKRLQTPSLTSSLLNIEERIKAITEKARQAGEAAPRGGATVGQDFPKQQAEARAAFEKAAHDAELARRVETQALARHNAELERQFSLQKISIDQFYSGRLAAQEEFTAKTVAQYQKEIAAAEKLRDATSKAGTPLLDAPARAAQESKIADLRQRQVEVTQQLTETTKELQTQQELAGRALQRDINATTAALLEQQGKLAEAAALRFDTERATEINRARAEGNKQREQELDTLRKITIEQGSYAEAVQRTNEIAAELGRNEAIIAAQVHTGQLTSFEASAASDAAKRKAIAANEREIETLSRLGTLTAEQKSHIADLAAANAVLAASIDQVGQQINDAFISGAADALTEFVEHTKSATEAFNDFARSVVHAIDQMVAKALAEKLFQGMFGAGGAGGAAGIGGFLSGLFTGGGGAGTAAVGTQTTTVAFAQMMQHGGTFNANDLLLVGEKGPELIRPSFSGQVVPGASAGGNVNLSMVINTPDAASFQRSQGQILTTMGLATQRALARR